MNRNIRLLRRRWQLAAACCAILSAASSPTGAQQDAAEPRGTVRIDVTGSNIRRVDGESGLPVQVMTRAELLAGGVQTAQELLDRISANQSFGGYTEAKGEGGTLFGFTAASLRGLGSQRTLVLLNGKRIAPYALAAGQGVNLSAIPVSAIEKVEILKDGASAIYGTDAIGGVINVILRTDFRGVEVGSNYYRTQHGGGDNWRANAIAGSGDLATDKYNFFIAMDYLKQDPLKAAERATTRSAYIPGLGVDFTSFAAFPANIRQPPGFRGLRNPTIPFPSGATPESCFRPYSFPTNAGPFQCQFDYASIIETIPEAEKKTLIGRFTWQIDAHTTFFAEGSYYQGIFTQRVSPTPVSGAFSNTPMTLPPGSPYYPAAYVASVGGDPTAPLQLAYRLVDLGPRVDQGTAEQWRAVIGVQGTVKDWDYALTANSNANREVDDYKSGYVYETLFGPLLRSGVINPFGFNTGAVLDAMRATQITGQANVSRASNYGGDLKLSRSLYELPAGSLALALGIEGRREYLEQTNADFVVSGDNLGGAGAVPSLPGGSRTVWALYGEASIPFTRTFEATAAVRYDHYSDFGSTTNPKIAVRWQPARDLLLRGSWGTGFRVPTLSDLFQPLSGFPGGPYDDPVRCPITRSDTDCGADMIVKTGGNPQLQPEKSTQWGVGLVADPVNGLSVSIDYYWVEIRNLIDTLPPDETFANYAYWGASKVVRKPPTAEDIALGVPGAIAYVIGDQVNFGKLQTSGIDVDVRYRMLGNPLGQFTLGLTGTYVLDYHRSGINAPLYAAAAGTRGPDGAVTRWRHYATLDWSKGPWGATLANTFQSGYGEPCAKDIDGVSLDASGCDTRRVGAYSVWDLQGRYTGFRNLTLSLGIRNVLDTPPPVTNQGRSFQTGIDPNYGDPRGRMYYGAVRYAFK